MTAAELRFGAVKAARAELANLVEAYLARVTILDWADSATFHYARIRTELSAACRSDLEWREGAAPSR